MSTILRVGDVVELGECLVVEHLPRKRVESPRRGVLVTPRHKTLYGHRFVVEKTWSDNLSCAGLVFSKARARRLRDDKRYDTTGLVVEFEELDVQAGGIRVVGHMEWRFA